MDYESFYSQHVHGLKSNGKQAYGRCVFHDDNHASLSINLFTGQFRCHAPHCSVVGNAITFSRKLGVPTPVVTSDQPARASIPRVSPPPAVLSATGADELRPPPISRKVVKEYVYQNEDGTPRYKVLRYEPKGFAQMRLENGAWVFGLGETKRTLYHLPQMLLKKSEVIYLVEGEKDVETLEAKGLVATSSSGGAGNWADDFGPYFKERFVVILPDNDAPGAAYARAAADSISKAGGHVKIVRLPGAGDKEDVTDYFNRGGTIAALHEVCKNTLPYKPATASDLRPADYLRELGIEAYAEGGYLPNEYKAACDRIFKELAARDALKATDKTMEILDKAESVWGSCTTKNEFERFLAYIKEAHELSVAA